MGLKRFYRVLLPAFAVLVLGSVPAFGSGPVSVSETETAEAVFTRDNQDRELLDMVYFRSENGVSELSDDPFESEALGFLGNVK